MAVWVAEYVEDHMDVAALTFLSVISEQKCYVMLERHGVETISLVDREGGPLPVTVAGFSYCPLCMPRRVFDNLLHANLIEQDLPEDIVGRTFFRLAVAGQHCAKQVRQSALESQVETRLPPPDRADALP